MRYNGLVIQGKGRGVRLGFPTLNLKVPDNFAVDQGVYAAKVWLEGHEYTGALHYGPVPTFDENEISLEVFLFDFEQKGQIDALEFMLLEKIREVRKFPSAKELREQMDRDVAEIEAMI